MFKIPAKEYFWSSLSVPSSGGRDYVRSCLFSGNSSPRSKAFWVMLTTCSGEGSLFVCFFSDAGCIIEELPKLLSLIESCRLSNSLTLSTLSLITLFRSAYLSLLYSNFSYRLYSKNESLLALCLVELLRRRIFPIPWVKLPLNYGLILPSLSSFGFAWSSWYSLAFFSNVPFNFCCV